MVQKEWTLGPLRYVRNPMYVGAAAVIMGAGLVVSSPSIVMLGVAFLLTMHLFVVIFEEPALAEKFGPSYGQYRTSVHRWLIPQAICSASRSALLSGCCVGQPAYRLLSDSNVDWNQALYDVERFVRRNNLSQVPLDTYALSDDTPIVSQSYIWDCQTPTAKDLGKWVVVSANELLDTHNCSWLLSYPNESIGGGSMLAFHLPSSLPAEGSPGGPPRESEKRPFLGMPFDGKAAFREAIRQPDHIPAIIKRFQRSAQPQVNPAAAGTTAGPRPEPLHAPH
ncbi:MAG: methyltransferase family protein [Bryobacteraceae bacterium]